MKVAIEIALSTVKAPSLIVTVPETLPYKESIAVAVDGLPPTKVFKVVNVFKVLSQIELFILHWFKL